MGKVTDIGHDSNCYLQVIDQQLTQLTKKYDILKEVKKRKRKKKVVAKFKQLKVGLMDKQLKQKAESIRKSKIVS